MTRDAFVTPTRAALAVGSALALTATVPAMAAAPSGGASTSTAATPAAATTPHAAEPAKRVARPQIRTTVERGSGLVGRTAVYAGSVRHHAPGEHVRLEMRRGSAWRAVDRDAVAANGRFRVATKIRGMGDHAVRLRIVSNSARKGDTERVKAVHGFRRAVASYYGPGLYGSPLACGGTLSPGTIGVANKTLPCGTKLTLRVGDRQVAARVVDRGPYVGGREFDLTAATRSRLGFGSTGTVLVDR